MNLEDLTRVNFLIPPDNIEALKTHTKENWGTQAVNVALNNYARILQLYEAGEMVALMELLKELPTLSDYKPYEIDMSNHALSKFGRADQLFIIAALRWHRNRGDSQIFAPVMEFLQTTRGITTTLDNLYKMEKRHTHRVKDRDIPSLLEKGQYPPYLESKKRGGG